MLNVHYRMKAGKMPFPFRNNSLLNLSESKQYTIFTETLERLRSLTGKIKIIRYASRYSVQIHSRRDLKA